MDSEVLIVGAGPVGLTASILLSRLGVANRVVESRGELHQAPQAHVVSARSMEVFRAAGVDEGALRAAATQPEDLGGVHWVNTLAGPELGRIAFAPSDLMHILTASPTPMANLSQHRLEPILLESAQAHGGRIDFACGWENGEPTPDGFISTLSDGTRFESRYVLGCDGAASQVRRANGIEMTGPASVQSFINVFVVGNLRHLVDGRPAVLYWHIDPSSAGTFIAHDIDSTWIFMFPFDPDTAPAESFTETICRERVALALGGETDFEIRSVTPWRMTAQVAERYRSGRQFLVGDAAHRFPPTGGVGMNTGVADAFNLAWKLAAVLDGRAGDALLDSYETERRPIAQTNCDQSLRNFYRMGEVFAALGLEPDMDAATARAHIRSIPDDPARSARVQAAIDDQSEHFDMSGLDLGQSYETGALVPDGTPAPVVQNPVTDYVASTRPGARLPHAWLERDGERISTLDLVDRGSPVLLCGARPEPWRDAAASHGLTLHAIGDGSLQCTDDTWSAVCGFRADGAILLRPDGHVAWRSPTASADAKSRLASALAAVYAR